MLQLNGHTGEVLCVAYSPTLPLLLSGGRDGTLRVWELTTGREILCCVREADISNIVFRSSGDALVFVERFSRHPGNSPQGNLYLMTLPEFEVQDMQDTISATDRGIQFALQDCVLIFSGTAGGGLGGELAFRNCSAKRLPIPRGNWISRRTGINSFIIGADTRTMALATNEFVRVADICSENATNLYMAKGRVNSLALSPDLTRLVGCWNNRVTLWDTEGGSEVLEFTAHEGIVRSVAYRPDGGAVASGGKDGLVVIWDPTTGAVLARYDFGLGAVNQITFSPDSLTLAIAAKRGLCIVDAQ